MPVDDKRSEDKTLTESVRAEDITDAELVSEALAEPPAGDGIACPGPAPWGRGISWHRAGRHPCGERWLWAGPHGSRRLADPGQFGARGADQDTRGQSGGVTAQLADLAARPVQDASEEIAALKAELQASSPTPLP